MTKHFDVIILGAGTAGLNATGQVKRHTKNFVLLDGGEELGTTCARVGCMPSKAFIHIAEQFHSRKQFGRLGIEGGDALSLNTEDVMERVQDVRDILVDRVLSNSTDQMGEKFINEHATFIDAHTLKVGNETFSADKIILAVGSRPMLPAAWQALEDQVMSTDQFFEQESLPASMAVIGLGVIGLELGQALSQMDVDVKGIDALSNIAGLQDPEINKIAIALINKEFPLLLDQKASLEKHGNLIRVTAGDESFDVERVLVSVGRRSNIDKVGLDALGISLDENGLPDYDAHTMALTDAPHIFIAGDANNDSPILHEASYEGRIAGHNAGTNSLTKFKRNVPLHITFSEPNICQVGASLDQLNEDDIVIGDFAMGPHGRALVMGNNKGLIRLYADKQTGTLLGACMVAPRAEHLAHLIAWCIEQERTLQDMLRYPFYHPVFEEALQGAIRKALAQMDIDTTIPLELTPL
ncbi:MAG: dihydrolipoyl dehydrogenase [Arenicellales bacterium]